MQFHDAIGIDPDSKGCVACLVRRNGSPFQIKNFPLSSNGREALVEFITSVPDVLVGIEGRRGQSSPVELFLEEKGIAYHTIPALNVSSYLALTGSGDEETSKTSMASRRLLHLFIAMPDITRWSSLDDEELLTLSGGKKITGWDNFIKTIRTPLGRDFPLGLGQQIVIRNTAQSLLQMLDQKSQLDAALEDTVNARPIAKDIREHYAGIGSFTAALLVEEIITVDRFSNDDRLASYAGLTKRSYSTGSNLNQRKATSCNKRLKTAFITFAKGYLRCNKGSHLAHYHQHLLKRGMSRMEALKRIARALARDLYRYMRVALAEEESGKSVA